MQGLRRCTEMPSLRLARGMHIAECSCAHAKSRRRKKRCAALDLSSPKQSEIKSARTSSDGVVRHGARLIHPCQPQQQL